MVLADRDARGLGIALLVGAATLWFVRRHPAVEEKQAAEQRVATWFFRALGLAWQPAPEAVELDLFHDLGLLPDPTDHSLLPQPTDQDWSDELRGWVAGLPVTACRLRVWKGSGKYRRRVFDGLLLSMTLPIAPVPRPLRIETRSSWQELLSGFTGLGLPPASRVGSFEEIFTVTGVAPSDDTDAVPAALRLPLLRLAAITRAPFRVGLIDRDLLLALDQPSELPTGRLTHYLATARFDPAVAVERCLLRYDELRMLVETLRPEDIPEEVQD